MYYQVVGIPINARLLSPIPNEEQLTLKAASNVYGKAQVKPNKAKARLWDILSVVVFPIGIWKLISRAIDNHKKESALPSPEEMKQQITGLLQDQNKWLEIQEHEEVSKLEEFKQKQQALLEQQNLASLKAREETKNFLKKQHENFSKTVKTFNDETQRELKNNFKTLANNYEDEFAKINNTEIKILRESENKGLGDIQFELDNLNNYLRKAEIGIINEAPLINAQQQNEEKAFLQKALKLTSLTEFMAQFPAKEGNLKYDFLQAWGHLRFLKKNIHQIINTASARVLFQKTLQHTREKYNQYIRKNKSSFKTREPVIKAQAVLEKLEELAKENYKSYLEELNNVNLSEEVRGGKIQEMWKKLAQNREDSLTTYDYLKAQHALIKCVAPELTHTFNEMYARLLGPKVAPTVE